MIRLKVEIGRRRSVAAVVGMLSVLLLAAGSAHAVCGDDMDGVRRPCACGDVVVADTRLMPDDPVVVERCPADGLFLRAPAGAASIRLDLAGLSIVGAEAGTGIHVIDGGSDGAVITGGSDGQRGAVVGFTTGITGAARAIAQVSNVIVAGNSSDGIALRAAQTRLSGIHATRNGRDGLRVSGHGAEFEDVESFENGGYGARVRDASGRGTVSARANRRGDLLTGRRARSSTGLEVAP